MNVLARNAPIAPEGARKALCLRGWNLRIGRVKVEKRCFHQFVVTRLSLVICNSGKGTIRLSEKRFAKGLLSIEHDRVTLRTERMFQKIEGYHRVGRGNNNTRSRSTSTYSLIDH